MCGTLGVGQVTNDDVLKHLKAPVPEGVINALLDAGLRGVPRDALGFVALYVWNKSRGFTEGVGML